MSRPSLAALAVCAGVCLLHAPASLATPRVTYGPAPRYAQPPPPRYLLPPPPPRVVRRDPYDTPGHVVVGAGFGGMLLRTADGATLTPGYLLHLGLAVGQAEFALRSNLALSTAGLSPEGDSNLYATRATFNWRFLPCSTVHPVAGLGLESLVLTAPGRGPAHAFAATARVGLELAFPLREGALALGLDTHGHLPFATTEGFPEALDSMLGFGATLDYRF